MFLFHELLASLRQHNMGDRNLLDSDGMPFQFTAMPDLKPFTQIETDANPLLREAIGNGLNLWGSPLLYDFLIEPLHLCTVEKL